MKRALVTLGHPRHAGMLRALRVLDDAAEAHGWELRYVVPSREPLLDQVGLPAERTAVVPGLAGWRQWRGRLALPATLRSLVRLGRQAELFYSETLSTFPYCWWAGKLLGIPTVVHVYSSYGSARSYRKYGLGWARHVIAPSADSLELARTALGGFAAGTRTRVVYNGMDIERIARDAARPLPEALASLGRPRVGMVGNLDWRKNPRALIEATPAIRAAVPGVQVLLVGACPDAASEAQLRERVVALGLEGCVTITGFLANPFPVVRALDVLVHPALRDPFPLALLEGMALARPIVASAVGGIPEMLVAGESGVLVPPDDRDALAAAVIALLRDEARRHSLGQAAFRRLTTRFTLQAFADEMFSVFDQAAQEGRARWRR